MMAALGRSPSRREWAGLAAALAVLVLLVASDVAAGTDVTLTGTYAVAPFVAAVFAGVRATALVAVLMLVAAAVSPLWNMDFGSLSYDIRLAILVLTAGFAVLGAYALDRARSNARGLELLDAVGEIADGSLPLDETLRKVTEAVVPAVADFCLVDALRSGRLQRIAVRVVGHENDPGMERFLRARKPTIPDVVVAPKPGEVPRPNLWRSMPAPVLRQMSHDEDDFERLLELGPESAISAPMSARGREVGALTVGVGWSGRRYGDADLRLVENLAGRIGLALDNAGLFTDLESAERRLDTVMSVVDEAVVMHDPSGELIYANRAASEMLGLASTREAVATPTTDLRERFTIADEEGNELDPGSFVGRSLVPGEGPSEQVVRAALRETGEERWYQSRVKAIEGADGAVVQSVTVIEDITELKRAELERARVAEERAEVAHVLQRGLLPPALPAMHRWEAAAMYRPAGEVNEVGGDFYDAFLIGEAWMLVVGDVVGRGAAAASLTALARHTIRTAGSLTRDPEKALRMLHEALVERPDQALCTVAIALLPDDPTEPDPVQVRLVCAGHPLPFRLRSRETEEVGRPGPLLGAFPEPSWEISEVELDAGDQLAIYTDGVTEAPGASDRFGEERLRASLAGAATPLAAVGAVERALDRYIPGEPQDDAALLVIGRSQVEALVTDDTSLPVSSAETG
jgi:PAS domain S-box-containing protein